MTQPIAYLWREIDVADEDGVLHATSVMVPRPRYAAQAAHQFLLGEEYVLDEVDELARGIGVALTGGCAAHCREALLVTHERHEVLVDPGRREVVVVDDRLGVTMTEIVKADHA